MGRDITRTAIRPDRIEDYLRAHGYPDASITALRPLSEAAATGIKSYGYGAPLRVSFVAAGSAHDVVIRSMAPDPFGHERRGDRAAAFVDAFDAFPRIPRHIQPIDIGVFDESAYLRSVRGREFFLVTEFVEGQLYANDLRDAADRTTARRHDRERAEVLAGYLADLHAVPVDPACYARELRDTVGSGEGIFGLCDSYPAGHPVATADRLRAIELEAVRWRWTLKKYAHRARRTHGDFHPFNILFRQGLDFSVLDASRGISGEPADDVTCLSINYIFFALQRREDFTGALREVWNAFWRRYLDKTHDTELLTVVAPFFAWRALVVASPVWYPNIPDELRSRLFRFAERLLAGVRFHPFEVEGLLE